MRFTVFGASGFVGAALVRYLCGQGYDCDARVRGSEFSGKALGHVIYAIGVTSDFRSRPFDTVDAHVGELNKLLRTIDCESFLYLSSTRVYGRSASTAETAELAIKPEDPDQLYDITKIAGEALCLRDDRPTFRVARLSNVYGRGDSSANFLNALVREARSGAIELRTPAESAKDYIALENAVELLAGIAIGGKHRVYNVARGRNVSNTAIVEKLSAITGCRVVLRPAAGSRIFAPIDIHRIQAEFQFAPKDLLDELPALIAQSD